jgi:[acyl-carrier-protein] S-malonyltransferase
VAFLFPGQGSDLALAGRELAEALDSVRDLLGQATEWLGMEIEAPWDRGGRALERTAVLQPVLTAVTLGVHLALEEGGCAPTFVAGHSLGEVSAWAAAGGVSPSDAIRLAFHRGRIMERAARSAPGGMLAVRVRARDAVEEALTLGREQGWVDLAACNAPGEWVVSGDLNALRAIAAAYPATRLPVSGAWHGSGMASCAEEWALVLDSVSPAPLGPRFLSNRTGQVVGDHGAIPRLLGEALTNPVRWSDTMQTLVSEGVTDLVTVGPGKILRALARRNGLADRHFHSTHRPSDLQKTLERLGT